MPDNRFFLDSPLEKDSQIELCEGEHHHLSRVMRAVPGQIVEVINGKGALAKAQIETINRNNSKLFINKVKQSPPLSRKQILAQGLPKMHRLECIIEKGTELGVTEFLLMSTNRSTIKTLSEKKLQRLKQISISAVKQSGRLYLPKICMTAPLLKWIPPKMTILFGDLSKDSPKIADYKNDDHFLWLTGPESGLTPEEEKHLRTHNGCGVSLHKNILRTDTASIVALAFLCL